MPDPWRADAFLPLADRRALHPPRARLAPAARLRHHSRRRRTLGRRDVLQTGALYRMLRRLLRDELIEECDAPAGEGGDPAAALLPADEARPARARRRGRADVPPGSGRAAHRGRQTAATDMRTRLFRALLALFCRASSARGLATNCSTRRRRSIERSPCGWSTRRACLSTPPRRSSRFGARCGRGAAPRAPDPEEPHGQTAAGCAVRGARPSPRCSGSRRSSSRR